MTKTLTGLAMLLFFGLPGDDETLRFRFSRGDPNYQKLVSTRPREQPDPRRPA